MLISVGVITHLDHTEAKCDARHSRRYLDQDGEEQTDKDGRTNIDRFGCCLTASLLTAARRRLATRWPITAPLKWLKLQVLSKLVSRPNGSKPEALIEAAPEAAEIPESALIVAADALAVRTRRGQWWLPVE